MPGQDKPTDQDIVEQFLKASEKIYKNRKSPQDQFLWASLMVLQYIFPPETYENIRAQLAQRGEARIKLPDGSNLTIYTYTTGEGAR